MKIVILCLLLGISGKYIPVQDWSLTYNDACWCNYCIPQNWELCYNICKKLPLGVENKSFGISSIAYPVTTSKCGFTAEISNVNRKNTILSFSMVFTGSLNFLPKVPKVQWMSTEGIKTIKLIPSNQTFDIPLTNFMNNLTIFVSTFGGGKVDTDIYIFDTYIFS